MNDFLATVLTNLAIIVFGCTLLHQIFTMLLERIIPDRAQVYNEIFIFTNPALTHGVAKPSLKLKYLLPWKESPDLSAFGSSATKFLFLTRLFAVLGTITLGFAVIFGIISLYV